MSQSKKISVLIPNFNAANYVGQAIESILSQTVLPDEIIVVDDASTDDSWKIITNFADKYDFIKIYRNEKNSGVAYTRNRLISKASGFYLVFLDSDDLSLPTRIERQLNFLSNNEDVDVCGTNFYLIDKGNNIIGEKKFLETDTQCKKMMWRCPFGNNTIMIKKRCFDLLGGYDEEFLLAEDLDVWLRFSSKFKFYNIQENLVMYRIHGQNSVIQKRKELYKYSIKAIRKAIKEYNYNLSIVGYIYFYFKKIAIIMPTPILMFFSNFINKIK